MRRTSFALGCNALLLGGFPTCATLLLFDHTATHLLSFLPWLDLFLEVMIVTATFTFSDCNLYIASSSLPFVLFIGGFYTRLSQKGWPAWRKECTIRP